MMYNELHVNHAFVLWVRDIKVYITNIKHLKLYLHPFFSLKNVIRMF